MQSYFWTKTKVTTHYSFVCSVDMFSNVITQSEWTTKQHMIITSDMILRERESLLIIIVSLFCKAAPQANMIYHKFD